jgi:apolipoprotein N-acyltransferase
VPLEGTVSWPSFLVPRVFASERGPLERQRLHLRDGTEVGVLICWENLFADDAREIVSGGARLLAQVTNDNWFGRTAQPRQHNLAGVLRAVENGTPLVVASNTGPSQIVDRQGRVLASVDALFTSGTATATVALGGGGTLYTRVGDLFVAAGGLGALLAAVWRRRSPARSDLL